FLRHDNSKGNRESGVGSRISDSRLPIPYSRLFQHAVLEHIPRELDAHRLQAAEEGRLVAGGVVFADGDALADAQLAEAENVADHVVLAANLDDFRDTHDLAGPTLEASQLDNHLDGAADVSADDVDGQLEAGQLDHDLKTAQGVARVVGVDGGQ